MNFYKYHNKPETLHRHKEADTEVPSIFWEKYKRQPEELKKRENAIAKSSKYSQLYAEYVLKGPFPKGEAAIAKDANFSYWYAAHVLKGPFLKGENAIAKNVNFSYLYAKHMLKSRFPKGEAAIAKDVRYSGTYNAFLSTLK